MSEDVKSDVYLKALPLMTSGKAELLDDARLIKQLRALERRTGRSGKDSVDHEARGRDDVANAACGALVLASPRGRGWSSDPEAMDKAGREAKELVRMWADRRNGLGQTGRRIADFGIRHPHERDGE